MTALRDEQAALIEWLGRPETHGVPGPVERVETHISFVFLAGERAYKLKRAVKYSYVDFSTVEKRRAAAEAELAVNRRTAPEIYLGLAPVLRRGAGFAIGGMAEAAAAIDWLVVMRRFDQATLFDRLAARGALTEDDVAAVTDEILRFHQGAARAPGGAAPVARTIEVNHNSVLRAAVPRPLTRERAEALAAGCRARLAALAPLLDRRAAEGHVRDCHGDLHLRNICKIAGRPALFDAIEFDPELRRIDVYYDFAFLLMDLLHRGLARHANRALNIYAGAARDFAGLAALPLFLAMRATIRGHIAATLAPGHADEAARYGEAASYIALAEAALAPPPPVLLAIGGLSGTGKSLQSQAIAPGLGALPGALVLRSDAIRKELAGAAPTTRLAPEFYAPDWTERVYGELLNRAGTVLRAGHSVIVDAVSGRAEQRAAIEAVAMAAGAGFAGFWLAAPGAVRVARVGGRKGDASDADVAVVRRQAEPNPASVTWRRIDAGGEAAAAANEIAHALIAAGIALRAEK